jgi:flagellar biosynthetic protein FliR
MTSPFAALTEMVPFFVLASLRIALTLAGCPAPFGGVAPIRIRTAVSVALAIALCIPLVGRAPPIAVDAGSLLRAAACELLLGAVMGLTVRVTLAAAEVAGSLAGQAMGLGFATSVDPTFGDQMLPTTYLLGALASLIFFIFNGHHVVIATLAGSLSHIPIGQALPVAAKHGALHLGSDLVARGLQISAPVVATMFIVQLGTSFVSRTAQRVNLFAFSFSIAIAAGILVLWLSAPSLCTAIIAQVRRLPDAFLSIGAG